MREKPSRLIGDAKDAMQLVRRAPFFGAAKQIDSLQHFVERDAAMLENRAHLYRELFAALFLVAFPEANPGLPLAFPVAALKLGRPANSAAMRANLAIRPQSFLKVFKGLRFAMEGRFRQF
jgi:hypothetical protein